MPLPEIAADISLDQLWVDLVYTEARLGKNERTADLAAAFASLVERTQLTIRAQRAAWTQEIVAQAFVDEADDALDDAVAALDQALKDAGGAVFARHARYFKNAPDAVIRLGLESELRVVRGWPKALAKEPERALKLLGRTVETTIELGDAALAARRKAIASTGDHRSDAITTLIDDATAARRSLHVVLAQRAAKARLPRSWPDRFFRAGNRKPKLEDPIPPSSPATNPSSKRR